MELADNIFKPFSQFILYIFGYLTGVFLVPVLSFGLLRVEQFTGKPQVSATGWVERPKRNLLSAKAAIIIGLMFWMVLAVIWASST